MTTSKNETSVPYLREAPFYEAMDTFYSADEVAPLAHTIWTGDFMSLAKHDVACPICFERHAMLYRSVTPGAWRQQFYPCRICSENGWRIFKMPRLFKNLFRGKS